MLLYIYVVNQKVIAYDPPTQIYEQYISVV